MVRFAPLSWSRRHLRIVTLATAAGIGVAVLVLAYFQPQDLFIDHTVNEALPVPVSTAAPVAGTPTATATTTATTGPTARLVAQGRFRSGEHSTTGTAQLIDAPGHGVLLRLSAFRTSNGPAVHVWLSAAAAGADDGVVAKAPHLDLGGLKGNIGNQNYPVPSGVDVGRYPTVVIWCQRFSVTFGYAELA